MNSKKSRLFKVIGVAYYMWRTKNFIIITDHLNAGYVKPEVAHLFTDYLQPVIDRLNNMGREYNIEQMRKKDNGSQKK